MMRPCGLFFTTSFCPNFTKMSLNLWYCGKLKDLSQGMYERYLLHVRNQESLCVCVCVCVCAGFGLGWGIFTWHRIGGLPFVAIEAAVNTCVPPGEMCEGERLSCVNDHTALRGVGQLGREKQTRGISPRHCSVHCGAVTRGKVTGSKVKCKVKTHSVNNDMFQSIRFEKIYVVS